MLLHPQKPWMQLLTHGLTSTTVWLYHPTDEVVAWIKPTYRTVDVITYPCLNMDSGLADPYIEMSNPCMLFEEAHQW